MKFKFNPLLYII